jgi:hypothetical protein
VTCCSKQKTTGTETGRRQLKSGAQKQDGGPDSKFLHIDRSQMRQPKNRRQIKWAVDRCARHNSRKTSHEWEPWPQKKIENLSKLKINPKTKYAMAESEQRACLVGDCSLPQLKLVVCDGVPTLWQRFAVMPNFSCVKFECGKYLICYHRSYHKYGKYLWQVFGSLSNLTSHISFQS